LQRVHVSSFPTNIKELPDPVIEAIIQHLPCGETVHGRMPKRWQRLALSQGWFHIFDTRHYDSNIRKWMKVKWIACGGYASCSHGGGYVQSLSMCRLRVEQNGELLKQCPKLRHVVFAKTEIDVKIVEYLRKELHHGLK